MDNKLEKLRNRYPHHVPVICVHSRDEKKEQKLIVPNETTGAAFLEIARQKCSWAVQGGKVLLCKGKGSATMEVPAERTMKQLDSMYKAPSGALYFRVEAAAKDAVEGPQEFKMDEAVPQDQKKPKAKVAISEDDIAEKARRIRMKHPDRVPVLVNQAEAPGLPALDKKLLIPKTMTCKDLRKILPKHLGCGHLDVDWSKVIFQLAGVDVEEHELVSEIYARCVAPDDEGILLSLELPSEDVPELAARHCKPPELSEKAEEDFSPPSAEELRVLEQQLIEVNLAFGEARKAQQIAADKLAQEEERAWAAEERALKADQELTMRCQAHKHEAEALQSEIAEARQAREALELKLAKGTEEIDALRLHVDWLEDALQSAKQDSSKMAELQKSLKESQEALAVEARKSHAAQEKLSQLEEQFQDAADKEAKAMRTYTAKEKGAEEKIRELEDSLAAVSEKLVEVEHEKAQLEREAEKQHRNPDEAVKKLKDTVLILKDTLSCKEEDITAKNAQVVEAMACLKAVEAENRRLQAELKAAAKETQKLQKDHALAKGEVDELKAKMQKKDTEDDFVKLGWNSDDEVEEVTEDFGFQKVYSASAASAASA
ncbi:ANKRD50 [Symbiodinium sp. CCMP2456]|nr:ANKRD50 [Symbiodinium sp. CCMP2456]